VELKPPPSSVSCRVCQTFACYVGTEDGYRIYVCEYGHLTRVPVVNKPNPLVTQ
jgi:hypothetical protein